jgi:hypothetical protein
MQSNTDNPAELGFDAFLMANPVTAFAGTGIAALSQAADFVKQLTAQIESIFGIGKGRKEADLIVPYQNQLVSAPGAPLGIINTAYYLADLPEHGNAADLNQIYQITMQAINAFYRYIGAPSFNDRARWPDGRASQQAYATIQPYATDVLAFLKKRLIAAGGTLQAIPPIYAGGSIGGQLANELLALGDVETGTTVQYGGQLSGLLQGNNVLLLGAIAVAIAFAIGGRK